MCCNAFGPLQCRGVAHLSSLLNRIIAIGGAFAVVSTVAFGQTGGVRLAPAKASQVDVSSPAKTAAPLLAVPDGDLDSLRGAIAAARLGDVAGAQNFAEQIKSPAGRKLAHWVIADARGDDFGFSQLEPYRRELADWPRNTKRRAQLESVLETSGLDASAVIGWFAGETPKTPYGAMALASAYQATGRSTEATDLIRSTWRTQPFDANAQKSVLARFGPMLSADDHVARANLLLYGPQGPALKDLLPLLPADQLALAQARIALRNDARTAPQLLAAVPASLKRDPGLAVEKSGYSRRRDQPAEALALASALPANLTSEDAATRVWTERRQLINIALKRQDYRAAYALAANAGMSAPSDVVDAEFFAGWLALVRLKDSTRADAHFARIQAAGTAPVTQSRALYWRGRAHEAMGDKTGSTAFYNQAARYGWTFYGQLAAGEIGAPIRLGADPQVTPADRTTFGADDRIQAARMLAAIGEHDLTRVFVLFIDDGLTSGAQFAQLVDLAQDAGDQDLVLRVARVAAQKGFILPGRGYPVLPTSSASVEQALILGVTRQESSFDPAAHSSADARGLMQLMPATAQHVAARLGEAYSLNALYDGDYNMRLGSAYLGDLTDHFTGSYVLAVAAYNAGPNRPDDWVQYCGDPRSPGVDPIDFIECIPFSETRNYVMRVLEGVQVYRAKLAKGQAPATLARDLKRGSGAFAATEAAVQP